MQALIPSSKVVPPAGFAAATGVKVSFKFTKHRTLVVTMKDPKRAIAKQAGKKGLTLLFEGYARASSGSVHGINRPRICFTANVLVCKH